MDWLPNGNIDPATGLEWWEPVLPPMTACGGMSLGPPYGVASRAPPLPTASDEPAATPPTEA